MESILKVDGNEGAFQTLQDCLLYGSLSPYDVILMLENESLEYNENLKKELTSNYPNSKNFNCIKNLLQFNMEEIKIWNLIKHLFACRMIPITKSSNNFSDLSPKETIINEFKYNSKLKEAQIILNWCQFYFCQQFMTDFDNPDFSNYNFLDETRRCIETGDKTLINNFDIDAVNNQNKPLAPLDQEYESRLLGNVLLCLRCGMYNKAKELCIQFGQAWRSDTLDGWKLYHDHNLKKIDDDGESPLEQDKSTVTGYYGAGGFKSKLRATKKCGIEGNLNRITWKNVCWKMYLDDYNSTTLKTNLVSAYEIAIYSYLSGNVKGVLPVLDHDEWDQLLWIYTQVMIDIHIEKALKNNPSKYDFLINFTNSDDQFARCLPSEYWKQPDDFEDIFEIIDLSCTKQTNYGTDQSILLGIFRTVIKLLILDDFEGLLEYISKSCESIYQDSFKHTFAGVKSSSVFTTEPLNTMQRSSLKFLTHLALVIVPSYVDYIYPARNILTDRYKTFSEPVYINILDNYVKSLMYPKSRINQFLNYLKLLPKTYQKNRLIRYLQDYSFIDYECKRSILEDIHNRENEYDLTSVLCELLESEYCKLGVIDEEMLKVMTKSFEWFVLGFSSTFNLEHFQIINLLYGNLLARKYFYLKDMKNAEIVVKYFTSELTNSLLDYYIQYYQTIKPINQDEFNIEALPILLKNIIDESVCYRMYLESIKSFDQWLEHYNNSDKLFREFEKHYSTTTNTTTVPQQIIPTKIIDDETILHNSTTQGSIVGANENNRNFLHSTPFHPSNLLKNSGPFDTLLDNTTFEHLSSRNTSSLLYDTQNLRKSIMAQKRSQHLKDELIKWIQIFQLKTENTAELLYSVLDFPNQNGWLTDDLIEKGDRESSYMEETIDKFDIQSIANKLIASDKNRNREMNEIRALLLPRIVTLLVQVLKAAGLIIKTCTDMDVLNNKRLKLSDQNDSTILPKNGESKTICDDPSTFIREDDDADSLSFIKHSSAVPEKDVSTINSEDFVNYEDKLYQVARTIFERRIKGVYADGEQDFTEKVLADNDLIKYLHESYKD